jgi:hypothetical protein
MDAQRERSSERPAVRTMCVILVRTFDEQGQCSSNVRTKLDMAYKNIFMPHAPRLYMHCAVHTTRLYKR